MIPKTYADLRDMSDEELIEAFDKEAENVPLRMDFLKDELLRREVTRSADVMTRLTRWITVLTVVNVVLVGVNVVLVAIN